MVAGRDALGLLSLLLLASLGLGRATWMRYPLPATVSTFSSSTLACESRRSKFSLSNRFSGSTPPPPVAPVFAVVLARGEESAGIAAPCEEARGCEGASDGVCEGASESACEGAIEGVCEGASDGVCEGEPKCAGVRSFCGAGE